MSIGDAPDRPTNEEIAEQENTMIYRDLGGTVVSTPTFSPFKHDDVIMTREDFIEQVGQLFFIDYDGFGELATATQCSNIYIKPSDIENNFVFPEWATHVVWYNR